MPNLNIEEFDSISKATYRKIISSRFIGTLNIKQAQKINNLNIKLLKLPWYMCLEFSLVFTLIPV